MNIPDNNKEEIFKVKNIFDLKDKYNIVFSDFISPFTRKYTEVDYIKKYKPKFISFFGGYEDAERTIIGVSEFNSIETFEFPISTILLQCEDKINHRSTLGSILGLGINRSKLGDILVDNNKALVFSHNDIAEYIANNLKYIGKSQIDDIKIINDNYLIDDFLKRNYKIINIILNSLRLDGVLSHAFNISRNEAEELIKSQLVAVNWLYIQKSHYEVKVGDIISVRGYGRLQITDVLGYTKKGRISIEIKRYM